MIKLLVFTLGTAAIAFIWWWFFGPHEATTEAATQSAQGQSVAITVKGGYSPERVVLKQGTPATLTFTREDPSPCLDAVVFPDFGVNVALPEHQPVTVTIDTSKPGEYTWACGMDMFHGQVVIEAN